MNNSIPNVRCLVVKVPFQAGKKVLRRRPGVGCVFLKALFTGRGKRGGLFFPEKNSLPRGYGREIVLPGRKGDGGGARRFLGAIPTTG